MNPWCLTVCKSGDLACILSTNQESGRLEQAVPIVHTEFLALSWAAEAEEFSLTDKRLPIASCWDRLNFLSRIWHYFPFTTWWLPTIVEVICVFDNRGTIFQVSTFMQNQIVNNLINIRISIRPRFWTQTPGLYRKFIKKAPSFSSCSSIRISTFSRKL